MNAEEIKTARGAKSQQEFAMLLGVSIATVSRWENGHTKISRLAQNEIERLKKKEGKK